MWWNQHVHACQEYKAHHGILWQGGCHSAKLDEERLPKFTMQPFYKRLLHV